MEKKRVLVVFTTSFAPNDGATNVIMNYYRNMNLDNLQIDFASHNEADTQLLREIEEKGCRYYNLKNRANVFSYFLKLFLILRHYDILHVNGNSATSSIELLAGKFAGTKLRIAHNHNTKTDHPLIHKLLLPIFKFSYNLCLACSTEAGKWIFGDGNFIVLINAIDLEKYEFSSSDRKEYRENLHISDSTIIVGHVGAFNEQKNHQKLLGIFREFLKIHSDAKLLLVGDGHYLNMIKDKVKEMGLGGNVLFMGMRKDIPSILSTMDVFVFPSKFEGLGLAVIEAQASGLPCLLSDQVPQDVYLSENVYALSLEQRNEVWAKEVDKIIITDRKRQSDKNYMSITYGGYNIKTEAIKLEELYLSRSFSKVK